MDSHELCDRAAGVVGHQRHVTQIELLEKLCDESRDAVWAEVGSVSQRPAVRT